jgi:hypothetical protein
MNGINKSNFERPSFVKHFGKAKLHHDEFVIDVDFRYYLINERGVLFCTSDQPLSFLQSISLWNSKWMIIGRNQEDKSFRSLDLFLTKYDGKSSFELEQRNDIIIGEIKKGEENDFATYWVSNFFANNFEFEYAGFRVEVKRISNYDHVLIQKYWQIPQFGSTIKLIKKNESKEAYDTLINSIVTLLTLAFGKALSFPLREFGKNGHSLVLISNTRSTHRKIQSIISEESLGQYLVAVLPYFNEEFNVNYLELRTLLEYVNSTDIGYLDDRVLSMVQAWEIIAKKWGRPYEIAEEIKELKKNIRPIIQEWHQKYPNFDKAMISQRISDSLIWDKTIKRLEDLLEQYKFNREVLDVDFKSLVKWRHKVAHEGVLHSVDNDNVADKLLDAQFAVRLLILKRIGYSGKVLPNKGYSTLKSIDDYFMIS